VGEGGDRPLLLVLWDYARDRRITAVAWREELHPGAGGMTWRTRKPVPYPASLLERLAMGFKAWRNNRKVAING
jgi:hypothetical protein